MKLQDSWDFRLENSKVIKEKNTVDKSKICKQLVSLLTYNLTRSTKKILSNKEIGGHKKITKTWMIIS